MEKKIKFLIAGILLALPLTGCGGGGGGGGGAPATQAVATLYLFGQMSSVANTKIDSVLASMVVPDTAVLVNYSTPAPAGYAPNTFDMRSGFAQTSGPVKAAKISGTYNTSTKVLTVAVENTVPKVALQCYTSARTGSVKGAEIAQIVFKLVTPGTAPALPVQDLSAEVAQIRQLVSVPDVDYLIGSYVKFVTTYR